MWKKLTTFILAMILVSMNVIITAAVEVDETAQTNCICGRPCHQQTTNEHNKFDCINCGKNRTNCTCKCWCGSETTISNEITINGIPAHICKSCGQLCAHCTCGDREAALVLEEHIREGTVFADKVAKPKTLITTLVAVVLVAACAVVYAVYHVLMKNEQTRERLKEKSVILSKHNKILEKINEQANYKAAIPSAAKTAAEKAVVWNVDDVNPATVAFELVNAVHFGTTAISDVIPFLRYVSDYITDEDSAEAAALNGAYGRVFQDTQSAQKDIEKGKVEQELLNYFEPDFFYNNEKSVHKILGDYGSGSYNVSNITYLPYSNEVSFGGSAATAEHWAAEISQISRNSDKRGGHRFSQKYLAGGEDK